MPINMLYRQVLGLAAVVGDWWATHGTVGVNFFTCDQEVARPAESENSREVIPPCP